MEKKDRFNPGKDGFSRVPMPGFSGPGGGGSGRAIARVKRAVYKAARKEAKSITRETRTERHTSDKYTNPRPDSGGMVKAKRIYAANVRKGKSQQSAPMASESKMTAKGNPFRSTIAMTMQMARKGRTKRGRPKGDNDN